MTNAQLKKLGLIYHSDTEFPDVKLYTVMSLGFEIGLSINSTIHDVYRAIESRAKGQGFADGVNWERAENAKRFGVDVDDNQIQKDCPFRDPSERAIWLYGVQYGANFKDKKIKTDGNERIQT